MSKTYKVKWTSNAKEDLYGYFWFKTKYRRVVIAKTIKNKCESLVSKYELDKK